MNCRKTKNKILLPQYFGVIYFYLNLRIPAISLMIREQAVHLTKDIHFSGMDILDYFLT